MFNDYTWQIYLKAGGKQIASFFEQNLGGKLSQNYLEKLANFRSYYCPSPKDIENTKEQLQYILDEQNENKYSPFLRAENKTIDSAMRCLYEVIGDEVGDSSKAIFECFSAIIDYVTTELAMERPELFVPYYFKYNFNILTMIAQEFEIDLPPVPIKKDYEGRFYYYGLLCKAFKEFREKNKMTPYEFCAFLYDFAPHYIGGTDSYIIKDLPEPKSAFFIGSSQKDKYLDYGLDTITCWQCNPETRAGDMVVMYLTTPISAVDSVWRSVSIGFNDPFFYYYRCTYIGHPVRINRISQKQLKEDPVFKNLPLVRKNMQGINGVELMPSVYNRLIDLAKADVRKLEYIVSDGDLNIVNEKDVENKLVKPLIKKLGYLEEDYVQQLYIEIGNHNHTVIPDFVLLPITTRGHKSAFAVIEAKYRIANQKQMEEVQIQARSYARLLNTKYALIASKERLYLYSSDDDFSKEIFRATWAELNEADTFSYLLKRVGKNYH